MHIGSAPHLFCFGLGYSAYALCNRLSEEGWIISGTCRNEETRQRLKAHGFRMYLFDRDRPLQAPAEKLACVTDILISIPPDADGDPVLDLHRRHILEHPRLRWIGYLSSTGVYGDTGGALLDETAPLRPTSERSRRRVAAELAWLELHRAHRSPVVSFRLAGIYGPGRNALEQVLAGKAKRIERPGHLFSRIHVDDIATILRASLARTHPGHAYNVCDDKPAAPADVVAFASELLGVPPPPLIPFAEAQRQMSPMASSFWRDNRRIDNSRIKRELGVVLAYPDYRAGLTAIAAGLRPDEKEMAAI